MTGFKWGRCDGLNSVGTYVWYTICLPPPTSKNPCQTPKPLCTANLHDIVANLARGIPHGHDLWPVDTTNTIVQLAQPCVCWDLPETRACASDMVFKQPCGSRGLVTQVTSHGHAQNNWRDLHPLLTGCCVTCSQLGNMQVGGPHTVGGRRHQTACLAEHSNRGTQTQQACSKVQCWAQRTRLAERQVS